MSWRCSLSGSRFVSFDRRIVPKEWSLTLDRLAGIRHVITHARTRGPQDGDQDEYEQYDECAKAVEVFEAAVWRVG